MATDASDAGTTPSAALPVPAPGGAHRDALEAFAAAQDRVGELLGPSRTILVLLDGALRVTWASEITGVAPGLVLGRTPSEIFPGPAGLAMQADLERVLHDGERLRTERDVDFFGRRVVWSVSAAAAPDAAGRPAGVTLALTNITDLRDALDDARRRRRELEDLVAARGTEVAEWEERFRASLEAMPEGIGIYRPVLDDGGRYVDATVVFANATWRRQYSDDADPSGRSIYSFAGARTRFDLHRTVWETGRPFRGVVRTPTPDGVRTLDLHFVRAGDSLVGASRDMTEQLAAQEALAASEERFRTSLDSVLDTLAILRAERAPDGSITDFVIEYANRAWRETFADDDVDPAGRHLYATYPSFAPRRDQHVALVEGGGTWRTTVAVERGGRTRWLDTQAVRYRDGFVVASRDVTDQRALEQQLRHAQRMEAVGSLAAAVAHDFDNVLYGIGLFADYARRAHPEPGDPVAEDLEQITVGVASGKRLTRALLAFAREGPAEPRPVRLHEVIEPILALLARLVGEAITLEADVPRTLPAVLADPGQLEQVVMNLVINARDASPEGGTIRVHAGVVRLDAERALALDVRPGRFVRLEVADQGVGMSEAVQARAFEPFFSTKAADVGTGLGLATVYGIVRGAGGTIGIDSAPGRGTTMRVWLPAGARRTRTRPG